MSRRGSPKRRAPREAPESRQALRASAGHSRGASAKAAAGSSVEKFRAAKQAGFAPDAKVWRLLVHGAGPLCVEWFDLRHEGEEHFLDFEIGRDPRAQRDRARQVVEILK